MTVIFLDIDGVLNCSTSKSKCQEFVGIDTNKLRRLKEIIDVTNAQVVLTTTWKEGYELGAYKQTEPAAKYMNNKFRKFGIKVFDKIKDRRWVDRGEAILKWLDEHPEVNHWIILDDQRFMYYDDDRIEPHWVRTFFRGHGLTEIDKLFAIQILKGEISGPCFDESDYKYPGVGPDDPLGWNDC